MRHIWRSRFGGAVVVDIAGVYCNLGSVVTGDFTALAEFEKLVAIGSDLTGKATEPNGVIIACLGRACRGLLRNQPLS